METSGIYIFLTASVVVLIFLNCLMSKSINEWIPSSKERLGLYLIVWFVPLIGLLLANRIGDLGWFSKKHAKNGESSISGGLLGLDEIFNPSTKYIIETRDERKAEIRQEYEDSDDKDKNNEENT